MARMMSSGVGKSGTWLFSAYALGKVSFVSSLYMMRTEITEAS